MIEFNVPLVTGKENRYLDLVIRSKSFSGNGIFSAKAINLLKTITGVREVFLTSSCTSALDIIALLLDFKAGDEIIVPSFTHVGTVLPFIRAGATPVWCDIHPANLNLNETLLPSLITANTRAIIAVHYAGIPFRLDFIRDFCQKHNLFLIEDAAMAIGSEFKGKAIGSYGDFAVFSFHQTKNVHCGEGGALVINNPEFSEKTDLIYYSGTNRTAFNKGLVPSWTWQSIGANYNLSELQAAFLTAQLEETKEVNSKRRQLFNLYKSLLSGFIPADRLPDIDEDCLPNGHGFYLLCNNAEERSELITFLQNAGIEAVFHYQPLHLAPYWKGSFAESDLPVTEHVAETILRLPMHYSLKEHDVKFIAEKLAEFYAKC